METRENDCKEGYNWFMKIPLEAWARYALDINYKTDLVINNFRKIFNKRYYLSGTIQ
jgi:hypothetical protein